MRLVPGVAALFASALPGARADQLVTYTYTTAVSPGSIDGAGLFGTPGATLDSDPAILTFTVDVNRGVLILGTVQGTFFSVPATPDLSLLNVSASLTINGHTFSSPNTNDTIGLSGYGETDVNGAITGQDFDLETANATCLSFCPYVDTTSFGFDYIAGALIIPPGLSYFTSANGSTPGTYTLVSTYVTTPVVTVVNTTPEPSSVVLCATGLLAAAGAVRRHTPRA